MTAQPIHITRTFGPHELLAVEYRGQPVLLAGQLGAALGYAEASTLSDNINRKWADEFSLGRDYFKVEGGELAAFKALLDGIPADRRDPLRTTARLLLLTERGAWLAATLSRTSVGAAFRAWVVDDLLPAWRAAQEAAAPPVAPPGPSRLEQARAMRLQAEETERLALEQLAEWMAASSSAARRGCCPSLGVADTEPARVAHHRRAWFEVAR